MYRLREPICADFTVLSHGEFAEGFAIVRVQYVPVSARPSQSLCSVARCPLLQYLSFQTGYSATREVFRAMAKPSYKDSVDGVRFLSTAAGRWFLPPPSLRTLRSSIASIDVYEASKTRT